MSLEHKKTHKFFGNSILVLESTDANRHHISISHKKRLPMWNEVKFVRQELGKNNAFYVMVLPPEEYYVNIHPYCFHLWEVLSPEETEIWKGL